MKTPEHLQPFEAAARSYCAKVGVDPDATERMPHPLMKNIFIASPPLWHDAAERLIDLSMMLSSMREVANAPKVWVQ